VEELENVDVQSGGMEMVNGDEGRESGSQLVCVCRYKVIWSGSDIDGEAYETMFVIDFGNDEVRVSDDGVATESGICGEEHLVSDFESASRTSFGLENLDDRISLLTCFWSSDGDHCPSLHLSPSL